MGDDWRDGILTDDEIPARLFKLNQDRAGPAQQGSITPLPDTDLRTSGQRMVAAGSVPMGGGHLQRNRLGTTAPRRRASFILIRHRIGPPSFRKWCHQHLFSHPQEFI